MNKEVRVGLIGYGYAGKTFHAPTITAVPNLKLASVVERSGNASKERYPWVNVVKSVEELYRDDSIDLIVVTTPSPNHFDFVRDALLADKHVVVEKPFTVTSDEADQLIALAHERNKVLSVYHNRRWDGDFLTIRKIIEQQMLGRIVECEFHWSRFQPEVNVSLWRESGAQGSGTWYDRGSHFIDQALCLFGIPDTIQADLRVQRDGGQAVDYFVVTLEYADQMKVIMKSSKLVREEGPRYIMHGDKGSFIKYGFDPQEDALIAGLTPLSRGWGNEPKQLWGTVNTSIDGLNVTGQIQTIPGAYHAYYQNIYDHITGQAELAVKPEQARNTIRLIELAIQSNEERRTIRVNV